jgi:molybdenum-dependent DNA-binding transcriptional regulator ModE
MHFCMNWAAMRFDWNQVRAFLATVEEGSLSAAARALGQSQPTLSRQIGALEADLGVVLFERVGRGLELTPSGLDLVEHVRVMGDAATRVSSGRCSLGIAIFIPGLSPCVPRNVPDYTQNAAREALGLL